MITTDGITPSQGGKDYMQFIKEVKELRNKYTPNPTYPDKLKERKTAILWSHENWWDQSRQPQSSQWNLMGHVRKYHEIMKSFGAPVDMISETDDLSSYPFLLIPAYQQVDESLVNKWKEYVENGGHLIITCRTGTKTKDGHLWEGKFGLPIHNLIGAEIVAYDQLLENIHGTVSMDEQKYEWNNWADILEISGEAKTWATFTDQFYAPKPAVISRKIGNGAITYIAVDTDSGELEKEVLKKVYTSAKVNIEDYPQGVYVNWNDGFWIAVNYSSEHRSIEIPEKATILIGEKDLEPAGVVVWKE
jgi:beta-galactosidase